MQLPEHLRDWLTRPRPFETRPGDPGWPGDRPPRPPFDNIWFRAAGPGAGRSCANARSCWPIASDMTLLDTSLLPHGKSFFSAVQMASLDHAMWFHRDAGFDDWLLYAQDSPSASRRARLQSRRDLHRATGR